MYDEPLDRIAGWEVSSNGSNRQVLLHPKDLLYCFCANAAKNGCVDARWTSQLRLGSERVYLRTKSGVFCSRFRSLKQIKRRLGSDNFISIHQGVLVNLKCVDAVELNGNQKRVGINLGQEAGRRVIEWLVISRRQYGPLRRRFGL